jgi:hypothetical protein
MNFAFVEWKGGGVPIFLSKSIGKPDVWRVTGSTILEECGGENRNE